MSRYGIGIYGSAYYGPDSFLEFDASPVIAYPQSYGEIDISWTPPSGSWDYLRLVRNSYGFPRSAEDGDIVYSSAAPSTGIFIDSGLTPGRYFYYVVFVKETSTGAWKNAGQAYTFSTKNWGSSDLLWSYLPTVFKSGDSYDPLSSKDNTDLRKFIEIFGLEIDRYRTQIENVSHRYDIDYVDAQAIPSMLYEFGYQYEPELGIKQCRDLLSVATYLNKGRGSADVLWDYIRAFVGYDNVITLGKNLMLNTHDSSFEGSIGSWKILPGNTHTDPLALTSGAYTSTGILTDGALALTSVDAGDLEIVCVGDSPITSGIPVTAGVSYVFSAYSKAITTGRVFTTSISWYTSTGTLISTTVDGTPPTTNTSTWTRGYVVGTAPAGSAYAVAHIKIGETSGNKTHYVDACQFEANTSATTFEDARMLYITLKGTRVNFLTNPNFESSTTGWTAVNSTLALVSATLSDPVDTTISSSLLEITAPATISTTTSANASVGAKTITLTSVANIVANQIIKITNGTYTEYAYVTAVNGGTKVATLGGLTYGTYTGLAHAYSSGATVTGAAGVRSATMLISQENTHTFSVYAKSPVTAGLPAYRVIRWVDDATDIGYEISAANTLTSSWDRISVTGNAPLGADKAIVEYFFLPASGSQKNYIDAALFEAAPVAQSYFDGSHTSGNPDDTSWESTINASRSHYYLNRAVATSRLEATIPDWVNHGTLFTLLFDQPGVV